MMKMTETELVKVTGGKNNWQANLIEGASAATTGWAIGVGICGSTGVGAALTPACGYIGAKFGVALWAGVSGATGGF